MRIWASLVSGVVLGLSPLAMGPVAAAGLPAGSVAAPVVPPGHPAAVVAASGDAVPGARAADPAAPTREYLWNSTIARNAAVQQLQDAPERVGSRCSDDSASAVSSGVSVCMRRRIAAEPLQPGEPQRSGATQRPDEPQPSLEPQPSVEPPGPRGSTAAPVDHVVTELSASTTPDDVPLGHRSEVCEGSGSDGFRVQPVYAYTGASPDAKAMQKISVALGNVDAAFSGSALRTGGNRRVRWVTDKGSAGCHVMLRTVRITSGANDFDALMTDLESQGAITTIAVGTTKHLVWTEGYIDAPAYPGGPRSNTCGLGESYGDESPAGSTRPNRNLGGTRAAIDSRCWDLNGGGSVPAHELMHTLGSVQPGAPNYANDGHCDDEHDLMCYGPGMRYVCPPSNEAFFDCNNDDYFNTDPDAGQYLCKHWNTADSRYLEGWNVAQPPRAVTGLAVSGSGGVVRVTHGGTASCHGADHYRIQVSGLKTITTTKLSVSLNAPVGTYTVTVTPHSSYANAYGTPVSTRVTVTPAPNRRPVGRMVLSLTDGRGYGMLGYAIDPDTARSTRMRVVIPGVVNREYDSNYRWADMPAYTGWNRHEALLFLAQLPPGTHTVCFDAKDANTGGWYRLDCRTHTVK